VEDYLGTIKLFAGPFTPRNWAECDGKVLTIKGNEALFSILPVEFGLNLDSVTEKRCAGKEYSSN